MRKTLLHPACCLAACLAGLWIVRRIAGVPHGNLWLGAYLLACGYVCSLSLIPWLCFSDWGRSTHKKKMGDPEVLRDPIMALMVSYMPRYTLAAIIGTFAGIWASHAAIAGLYAVLMAASATHAAWRAMRWTPGPA